MDSTERDYIVVQDEQGIEKKFAVEALFDMEEQSYALLTAEEDAILMRIEGEELVGITDPNELDMVLSAYQIAVEAAPAE